MFGAVVGCLIAGAWYYVWLQAPRKRMRSTFEVLVAALAVHVFACCLLPGVTLPRHDVRRSQCTNCIKNITLAMLSYETVWKQLPPAITYDGTGRPMHSWRVLLLPHLGEQALYNMYNFDEPWDGPNNSRLLQSMPGIYRCPYSPKIKVDEYTCGYRVLVGEQTCFPPTGSRKLDEIRDGVANTLLIVESDQRVPWMSPSEPTLEEYMDEAKGWSPGRTTHGYSDLLSHYDCGGCCSFADATVRSWSIPVDEGLIPKLALIDDGVADLRVLDRPLYLGDSFRIRWEGYLAILAFVFLAGLPAFGFFPFRLKNVQQSKVKAARLERENEAG